MPINTYGQGNSANTPIKQEALRYFMRVHAGIVSYAQRWDKKYYYIDTNAGTGTNGDFSAGSVVIAYEEVVLTHHLHMIGTAIDIRSDALASLASLLGMIYPIKVIHGDNHQVLHPRLLPAKSWLFGLVYCDPNGVNDLPLDALMNFYRPTHTATQKIDLLIHFSGTALKRCYGAGLNKYTLPSIMQQINKKFWYVREPFERDQWTFLYGTNYDKWPPELKLRISGVPITGLDRLGMFCCTSDKGQAILETLIYTNRERQKKTLPLFPIEPIESISGTRNSFVFVPK